MNNKKGLKDQKEHSSCIGVSMKLYKINIYLYLYILNDNELLLFVWSVGISGYVSLPGSYMNAYVLFLHIINFDDHLEKKEPDNNYTYKYIHTHTYIYILVKRTGLLTSV